VLAGGSHLQVDGVEENFENEVLFHTERVSETNNYDKRKGICSQVLFDCKSSKPSFGQ
jgi:hypothetical protein